MRPSRTRRSKGHGPGSSSRRRELARPTPSESGNGTRDRGLVWRRSRRSLLWRPPAPGWRWGSRDQPSSPPNRVLLAGRADEALSVVVHARVFPILRRELVFRLDVGSTKVDGVDFVGSNPTRQQLLVSRARVET